MEQLALALSLPLELVGVFAIWNWSRSYRSFAWAILGATILLFIVIYFAFMGHNPLGNRLYAALFAMYLFSGLMWAWWIEGLNPNDWEIGEAFVALAAVALFSLASSPL